MTCSSKYARRGAVVSLLLGGSCLPWEVSAQMITGRTRVAETAAPVIGAWVVLLDATGAERAGVLTDAAGQFVLRAPGPGTYQLRARQLGFSPASSDRFEIVAAADAAPAVELIMAVAAVALAGIDVKGERRCGGRASDAAEAGVWNELQTALTGLQWTQREGTVTYRTREYVRQLDARMRTTKQDERIRVTRADRPFTTPAPLTLVERGFVRDSAELPLFFAPDLDVLMSEPFGATHCFQLRRDGRRGLVGLVFEPVRGRRVPDVSGTLWLDEQSGEVRSLEFGYTNVDFGPRTRELGGRLEFTRLASGAWITSAWQIRGPLLPMRSAAWRPGTRIELVGFQDVGAELVEVLPAEAPDTAAPTTAVTILRPLGESRSSSAPSERED